jgi:hypothetical protein
MSVCLEHVPGWGWVRYGFWVLHPLGGIWAGVVGG